MSCTCYRMCSDVMQALHGAHTQASQQPYVYMAHQGITYGRAICTSQMIFIKNNRLAF